MSTHRGGANRPQLTLIATPPPVTRPVIAAHDFARLENAARELLDRQNPMQVQIRTKLGEARVVPEGEVPDNVATIGSIIRYRAEGRLLERRELWIGSDPAPSEHYLNVFTPIGLALLGHAPGNVCEAELFNGMKLNVALVMLEFQPEAENRRRKSADTFDDLPDDDGPEAA